jgi:hypothetical protein
VAAVGMTGEQPWAIDLVRDRPHLLIGGTTGSGKSEFLRGWSLVWRWAPPDEVTFLLIDFKEVGLRSCASLPTPWDFHHRSRRLDGPEGTRLCARRSIAAKLLATPARSSDIIESGA